MTAPFVWNFLLSFLLCGSYAVGNGTTQLQVPTLFVYLVIRCATYASKMTLCFSDVETREAMRRLKEVSLTYGMDDGIVVNSSNVSKDVAVLKDFLEYLRTRESKRTPWEGNSPQLKYRMNLVRFMMNVSEIEKFSTETVYLAIYLLDHFMDNHEIPPVQLGLVGVNCMVIAGKLLEVNIPRYHSLARCIKACTMDSPKTIIKSLACLEGYILQSFKFDVLIPTEASFLEVYLLYVVDGLKYAVSSDMNNNNNNNSKFMPNANISDTANATHNENEYSVTYEDCDDSSYGQNEDLFESQDDYHGNYNDGLQDDYADVLFLPALEPFHRVPGTTTLELMQETALMILEEITRRAGPTKLFPPSQIAAAITLAARRQHGLNFWTPTLASITSYNLETVYKCLKQCIQPALLSLKMKPPTIPPYFVDMIFVPFILVGEN